MSVLLSHSFWGHLSQQPWEPEAAGKEIPGLRAEAALETTSKLAGFSPHPVLGSDPLSPTTLRFSGWPYHHSPRPTLNPGEFGSSNANSRHGIAEQKG